MANVLDVYVFFRFDLQSTLGLLFLAANSGCVTRDVVTPIYDRQGIHVELRGQVTNGEPVDRGFKQPTSISVRRLTNILNAIEYANASGMITVGMSGFSGGKLKEMSDHPVHVSIDDYGMAENMHMIIVHMIIIRTTALVADET